MLQMTRCILLWTFLLCSCLHGCFARDNLINSQSISDDESLVSAGERFELGFFTTSDNHTKYAGIWYYKKNPQAVVWVANRNCPLNDFTGVFAGITKDGNLKFWDRNGSSYCPINLPSSPSPGRTLTLLDSGNLVLRDDQSGNIVWQSFDHPTDTFLPGMEMHGNLALTSWKSHDDPGIGNFKFKQDEEDNKHYIIGNRSVPYWKSGEPGNFKGYNEMPLWVAVLLSNFTMSGTTGSSNSTISVRTRLRNITVSDFNNSRLVMNSSGVIQFFIWDNKKMVWSLKWSKPQKPCDVYGFCGKFGTCDGQSNLCKCLPGFLPSSPASWNSGEFSGGSPDNWNSGNFSNGCARKSTICTVGDTFLSLKMMKVQNPHDHFVDAQGDEECRVGCSNNCQCQAYTYVSSQRDGTNTPGCWLWTEELINLQQDYDGGCDLNVRIAASDIGLTNRSCGICGTNIIPYPLSTSRKCGDPLYSGFFCDKSSSTGQVWFKAANDPNRVISINPETHTFIIQAKNADYCRGINVLELNKSLPFRVTNLCYGDRNESEISWDPPLEPTCSSSKDCKDWPNSSCNATTSGLRCLCNENYNWNGSIINCTQGDVKTTHKKIVILIIVIVVVLLLCSISYISYKRIMARSQESRGTMRGNPVLHLYDGERRVKDLIDSGDFKEEDKKGIDVPFFDLESILAATDNFSMANKLGQGGFGPVYKGKFPGGQEIAVKRLSSHSGQGIEEFKNEVMLIAKLQHRNLVRLLGYCIKGDERILLYEYMPNKSLDAFIFDWVLCKLLNWEKRFDIILGIARGFLYLHQDSRLRIIHRDLKTGNVLLDEEMNPKISDFGLARIVGGKETEANTNRVVGTYGYMSPEYALDGLFSIKSDVFSFGVVVLEIISGKRNAGCYKSQEAMNLLGYVNVKISQSQLSLSNFSTSYVILMLSQAWRLWKEEKAMDLMDQTLLESYNRSEVLKCLIVGLLCVQEDPSERPTMSNVVVMLGCETATLPNPKKPAFVTRKLLSSAPSSSSSKPEALSNNQLTSTMEEGR